MSSRQSLFQQEVVIGDCWSALAVVAEACDLSRDELSDAASKGAVWVRKPASGTHQSKPRRVRDIDSAAVPGDTMVVNYNREVLSARPDLPKLISDQGNYSVWFKPAGLFSQGSKWGDHCTITATAQQVHGKRCLLVHRLDRAASGIMLIAHTKNALTALTSMFEQRKVVKIYQTFVHGNPQWQLPFRIDTAIESKPALTQIIESDYFSDKEQTLLKVNITSGRKHQIRRHLAGEGFPVVGDRLFDSKRVHETDLQLMAYQLQFTCPFNGKSLSFCVDRSLASKHN